MCIFTACKVILRKKVVTHHSICGCMPDCGQGWQQEGGVVVRRWARHDYLVFLMWSTAGKYPGVLSFSLRGAAPLASPRKNEASPN